MPRFPDYNFWFSNDSNEVQWIRHLERMKYIAYIKERKHRIKKEREMRHKQFVLEMERQYGIVNKC